MVRWTLIQTTPYFPSSNTMSAMWGCAWHVTSAIHQQYQPDTVGLSWYTVLSPWTYAVFIYLRLCVHICIRHMTCKEHQPCKHDTMIQVKVVWMLARCFWRRPDIKTTLGQRLVFAGKYTWLNSNTATLTKCWASVVDDVPALKQRWLYVIVQHYSVC